MNAYTFNGIGQINMNSTFGNCIYKIACLDTVTRIFEVGSWNGQGSTICLMNGVITKNNSILYSLEADSCMFNISNTFWNKKNTNGSLVLLNGILHNKIADLNDLNLLYNNNIPYFNEHYIPEKNLVKTSKIINIDNIEYLDFIILDGGEYTTQGDYDILMLKSPKYIALDDTAVYKCRIIRQLLLNNIDWEIYEENQNERNGWSVFIKK